MVADKPAKPFEFRLQVLKNFWRAMAEVNEQAHAEPDTNVLWGSIGVSASHMALAPVLVTILQSPTRDLKTSVFKEMLGQSSAVDYPFWFTKKGSKQAKDEYPEGKGDAIDIGHSTSQIVGLWAD